MYKTFAKKFEKALAKRNHSIEKKIVESRNKVRFYKLLNKKLKGRNFLGSIRSGGQVCLKDFVVCFLLTMILFQLRA